MCPVGTLTSSIPEGTNITAICSGNGRCLSLREVTNFRNFETHLDYTRYKGWDADKVHGCVCEPGWAGISCEKRLCPKGDDPVTAVSGPSTDVEVQLIDCLCTSCQGGLYISFQGQQTPLIPYDASAELIQFRFNVRHLHCHALVALSPCRQTNCVFYCAAIHIAAEGEG